MAASKSVRQGVIISTSLVVLVVAIFSLDATEIRAKVFDVVAYIESAGPFGPLLMFLCHCIAVIICFPGTILFEISSGFLFGLWGIALVTISKGVGGLIGFMLGKTLLHDFVKSKFAGDKRWESIYDHIGKEGWKFAVLLRLSPLPSWVNTYGLSTTSIGTLPFFFATIFGSLPMIFQNVYLGTLLGSLANLSSNSSNTTSEFSWFSWKSASMLATGASTLLLTRIIVRTISKSASVDRHPYGDTQKPPPLKRSGSNNNHPLSVNQVCSDTC
eukprot:TRINITY_DN22038_c0_g1_i1.p1 TRINITY_DN22038_c0_g1~~TRINITY_DN22038_c0_g1_i1.p1  ORF type:complete len:314 (+),score=22.11 TRINITY_DN22038_c0_g1_i1:127-942(+)